MPEDATASPGPDSFTGPLFIVGTGRSGTKLLRDLLRGHRRIRIPTVETNLLPRWMAEWERFGDLSDRDRFASFYRWNLRAPYFLYVARHPRGVIDESDWYASCRSFAPADVFEALIRRDVDAPQGSDLVWGDKSPDHVRHIDVLADLFPHARFIHIVRDVRDHSLSLNKRNSRNMVRAAQLWTDSIAKARRDAKGIANPYLEVRYEDLLADPDSELRRCCKLLDVDYDPSLVELQFSTEHTGDAAGAREVVATNARKYVEAMKPRTLRRIEKVAGPTLRELGYDVGYSGPARRVPAAAMACYRVLDGLNHLRVQSRRSGFARTAQLELGRLTRS